MSTKAVTWIIRIINLLAVLAFVAASRRIWFPTDSWLHNKLTPGIDWNYISFAVLVQAVEIFVYYMLIRIFWMHGTIITTAQNKGEVRGIPIATELIKTVGEAFALIIVEVHLIMALIEIFDVSLHYDMIHVRFVPIFMYDFYNGLKTYLFEDVHFLGETIFIPVATIITGTLLALSQLFISYKFSNLFRK